jgi:hypothetical protein
MRAMRLQRRMKGALAVFVLILCGAAECAP